MTTFNSQDAESKYQSLLKDAILELRRMQAELDALQQAQQEPIAIIGMACRFPGGATTPDRYWELLAAGRSAVQEIPGDRWNVDAYYDPNPDLPGKMYTRSGCFIDGVAEFDAQRFGIAPREAIEIDPQQRLLLEVTHEALENAGQAIDQLKGSRTGVFVGVCFDDYGRASVTSGDPTQIDAYSSLGNTRSIAAGRIAYTFGLQGPTVQLDTSCSSSLVALHLACQSLRLQESNLALVGGVNLMLAPEPMIGFCKLKALSPDGQCKPFDAAANGYGRGEGCGMVVLKRLSAAIADRDPILAVIRGSAVNHDGASNGLTAPNGLAQSAVIRQALANAQVEPQAIDYIETHGTGTVLGDPIEVLALAEVFAQHRQTPLQIGAVKANIGHLESAAGVAGLIKLVLSLQHQQIPPHSCTQPNPHIPWDRLPIAIPNHLTPWQRDRRLAGLSAFGMSGTNAHVIVENAPAIAPLSNFTVDRPLHLLTLSAKTPKALTDLLQKYLNYFAADPTLSFADVCFSANTGRSQLDYRLSMVAATTVEATAILQTQLTSAIVQPVKKTLSPPKLVFWFPGEDSEYAGMGTELYETQPQFKQAFDHCIQLIQPNLDNPRLLLNPPTGDRPTDQVHLTVFAVEYALCRLWQSWGIQPDRAIGDGVGTYVAACISGALSLEAALKQAMARSPLPAVMDFPDDKDCLCLVMGAQSTRLAPPPQISSANHQCLASFDPQQSEWAVMLDSLSQLYTQGFAIKWAEFDRPYPRQRIALPTYPFQRQRFWRDRPVSLPKMRSVVHPLLGAPLQVAKSNHSYFEQHLCQTTQPFLRHHRVFGQVILPAAAYLEIALAAGQHFLSNQTMTLREMKILQPWIVPEQAEASLQTVLTSTVENPESYHFEIVSQASKTDWMHPSFAMQPSSPTLLPQEKGAKFKASLFEKKNSALIPNPTIQALRSTSIEKGSAIQSPSPWGEGFRVRAVDVGSTQTDLTSTKWETYASGILAVHQDQKPVDIDLKSYQVLCPDPLDIASYYQQCDQHGIEYGDDFQTLQQLWRGENQAIALVQVSRSLQHEITQYAIHPTLLDGCFQAIGALLPASSHQTYLPVGCQQFTVYQSAKDTLWSLVQWRDRDQLTVDLQLVNEAGERIADVIALQLKAVTLPTRSQISDASPPDWQNWLYRVEWQIPSPASILPTPVELSEQLSPHFSHLLAQPAFQTYADYLPELEALSLVYIQQAIAQLGCDFAAIEIFGITELLQQLAIVPQQQALFRRMLEILAEAQILEVREDLGRVIQPWTAADDREESLIADSAVTSAIEYTLLHRTGSHLAEILQGKRDPLQLLFPDGDISLLTQLYQESPGARVMNTLIQQAIAQIQSQFSTERSLRILEVGAGTGGTTAQILPHLQPDRTEYVFTDLSPLFLSKAQQKFVDYPFMRYQRLDLERSPQTQGFSPSQFQVILAANVLHATQDLHQTLSHLRSLLAPGGCLILLEGTKPLRWVDLIFGLTEGWWRFQDYQLRPNHPLISVQQWQTLLSEVGFESAIALQPDAYPNQETAFQSILIANTPTAPKLDQVACQNWLILDKESEPESLGIALKNQLETLNHTVQYFSDIPTIDLVSILLSTQFDHILDLRGLSTIDESLRRSKPFQQTDLVSLDLQVQTSCSILLELIQAITSTVLENFPQLTIVTQGAIADDSTTLSGLAQSSLLGLAKVIRLEHPELNARCLDLDPTQPQLSQVEVLLACLLLDRSENEMAWRQNTWQVPRLIRDELSPENSTSTNDRLIIETPGNLDSLQFAPSQRRSPKPHEVEIQVHATGLNFRDVLNALGVYPGEAGELGCECAGTIAQVGEAVTHFTVGQAAIALAAGSFGQYITVDAALVVATPANLSLEAAATIPAAFLTAHHALQQLATIKPGDRVLIHAAAGGVGQAAIQIAQQAGAEIFATASPEKQELVRSLGVTHVFNSRAVEFSEQILSITNGAGVNIILNSLSGDFIAKSCAILQPNGCFLELGKLNIWSAEEFAKVLPQAQYHLIDLVELCQQQPDLVQSQLQAIAAQFESHQLRPLPTKTFSRSQIIPAFRWMQQGKHTGKLVITQTRFDTTLEIYRDRTYLITGGLGGLGLLMAEWLIRQGATRLVLVGRNPHRSPEQVQQLQSTGAAVQVVAADVCDRAAVAQILTDIAASDYPLAGVIHAAGGLADATLRQLSPDQLAEVLQPKVTGAWNLHQLTAHLPLDFFVLFSSATALFGSPGQANHVAANTFLDALAHYRQSQGLPALSINWGTWSQVGAAAARQADTRLEQLGISAIAPPIGQEIFASLLHRSLTQIGVIPIDWTQFFQQNRSTPFLEYFQQDSTNSVEQARSPSPQSPSLILQTLATASDRAVALKEYVRSQIAQILGFQPQEIDPQTGFFDLGMDSLTSVELKSRLQTDLNCTLPTTIAFDYPTLDALIPHLLSQIDLNNEFTPNKTIVQPDNLSLIPSSELSDLTEAEIATLLAQELEIH